MRGTECWPSREEEEQLLARVLAGSRTVREEVAARYLVLLERFLRAAYPRAGDELRAEAAGEAIVQFLTKPVAYDPTQKCLSAYLRMSAEGDLLNLLNREARARRVPLDSVAEPVDYRKTPGTCESPLADPRIAGEYAALSSNERAAFELMCEGVRETEVFAEQLGLLHLSLVERRAEVKRTKDRIQKRFARAIGDTP